MIKNLIVALVLASASAIKVGVPPVKNTCVNPSKATGADQPCSHVGNSAWNTHSSAVTADPRNAQAAPYPDHVAHIPGWTAPTPAPKAP